MVDLGFDLGAHTILQGSPNQCFSYKINIESQKGSPGRRFEQTWFLNGFWCQIRMPWETKTSISHYTCCNLRGFAGSSILMKNAPQKVFQDHSKLEPRAPKGWNFLIRGWCRFSILHFLGFLYPCGPAGTQPGPNQDPTGTQLHPNWDPTAPRRGSTGDFGQLGVSVASTYARYLR